MTCWELHHARDSFPKFSTDWDRLNSKLFNRHPFFDSRFIGPLLKFFATGEELLCLHRQEGLITGALILQPNGPGRWTSFRPSQAQITGILLENLDDLATLFPVLPGFVWTIDLIAVDPRFAPKANRIEQTLLLSPQTYTIGIRAGLSFAEYWNKRSKNLRANMRRYFNRLAREYGDSSEHECRRPIEIDSAVSRFGTLESAGWKGSAGTAVSSNNKQGLFYAELLQNFARDGHAAVCELRLGNQLAASRLIIENQHLSIILKTTYAENMSRIAPGRIQLYRLIQERLTRDHNQSIEFYTNATRDQKEWATFGCIVQNIQVFRNLFFLNVFAVSKGLRNALDETATTDENSNNVRIEAVPDIESLRHTCLGLTAISRESPYDTDVEWFDVLQRTVYPDSTDVHYYFAANDKQIQTLLPLRVSRRHGIRTIESLGNFYTALYAPLKADKEDISSLRQLLKRVTTDLAGVHVMCFAPMDPASPEYQEIINHLLSLGWPPFQFRCFGNWYLQVNNGWDNYLKHRSANLRSRIKRRTRRFKDDGGQLEVVDQSPAIDQVIADFQQVYSDSWKIPEPYPKFIPALIRKLADTGKLRMGFARLDGEPIAAQLWILTGKTASIYKVAYKEQFASYSPGTVLTAHLLRHVIERDKVTEVDFLIGDDEYKKEWMSDYRERWGIIAYNPRTVIGSILLLKELTGRSAKALSVSASKLFNNWAQARIDLQHQSKPGQASGTPAESDKTNMTWEIMPATQYGAHIRYWDDLVRSTPGTPFLESAFLLPALEVFGTGNELLCLYRLDGKLRAASIVKRQSKIMWQTFQPSQLPLGAWICDPEIDCEKICEELIRQLPGISLGIGLSQIDPRLVSRQMDNTRIRTQDYIQTSWVDIEEDFDTYWDARGKNLKQNMRKQRHKLAAEGIEARIECLTQAKDVAQALEDYARLEGTGWKAADGTAVLATNSQGKFYRQMLENYCTAGRGRLYRYWFAGKVVAMDLCICDQTTLVILKTAYDESIKSVSPSTLMRQEQFQQLFEEKKFSRIEFFGKVMEWHTRWTQKKRTLFHLTTYRWAWLKQLHATMSGTEQPPEPFTTNR